MGQGGRLHRRPDHPLLGSGHRVLQGQPPRLPLPVVPVLHAVGPVRHLPGPGLAHAGRGLFQVQRGHRAQPAPAVHPALGRPGPQPVQRHLEVQHSSVQVLRGLAGAGAEPPLLGRGGIRVADRSAVVQVLRRSQRVPDPWARTCCPEWAASASLSLP